MLTRDNIVKAEKIIKEYLTPKYAWNESEYKIRIDSKESTRHIVEFMIDHKDDEEPIAPGGGKSCVIKFDMRKMAVVRELGFQ